VLLYALTLPGLEGIAAREIGGLPGARVTETSSGLVYFQLAGQPDGLLELGTVEDVFALVARGPVDTERDGLGQAEEMVAGASGFEPALVALSQLRPRRVRQVSFRVVVQRPSGRHQYVRQELGRCVGRAVGRRFARWKQVDENATLEIWVLQCGSQTTLGVRLSDRTLRHRTYKRAHLAASLRPVVARAMVHCASPGPDDVFLDPMCGAGTLLIERGEHGRYARLLGGDLSREAVAAASVNVGPRYQPISLQRWDATRLPLASASVNRIACNLPFGRQIGRLPELADLYSAFLREARRVLVDGSVLVLLSSQTRLLRGLLLRVPGLRLRETVPVLVLGQRAAIFTAIMDA